MQYVQWANVALIWLAVVAMLVWRKSLWPPPAATVGALTAGTFAMAGGIAWLAAPFYVFAAVDVVMLVGALRARKAASQ